MNSLLPKILSTIQYSNIYFTHWFRMLEGRDPVILGWKLAFKNNSKTGAAFLKQSMANQ
jgi:hypothetical protein